MEYYKVVVKKPNQQPKEEYFFDKKDAQFAKGFYTDIDTSVELVTLNTDNLPKA